MEDYPVKRADPLPGMHMFLHSCERLIQVMGPCCNAPQAGMAPLVKFRATSWLHWQAASVTVSLVKECADLF